MQKNPIYFFLTTIHKAKLFGMLTGKQNLLRKNYYNDLKTIENRYFVYDECVAVAHIFSARIFGLSESTDI